MEKDDGKTIWINKKTGLERRLNDFTVRKLGKWLTDNYYQVEQPTRPKENPPEVQALLDKAKKVDCCGKDGCECKDNVCIPAEDLLSLAEKPLVITDPIIKEKYENFNGDETTTTEIRAEYKPALTPKNKGGRPKSKRK